MEVIVLAAGYGTRLYPLTENTPKPLLNVAGKPIVEHIVSKLEKIGLINKIYIATNDKFEQHFKAWLNKLDTAKSIEIISDGTKSNDDRLGALGDIDFIINEKGINDEILVISGDNLFELSLQDVINFFNKKKSNVVVLHDVKDFELAKHYGIVEVSNNTIVNFQEKPIVPKSTLASTGIYIFPKKTIPLIKKYVAQGNNTDKTGNFIEWLHKRESVHAYVTEEKWYDIGNIEEFEKANKHYKKK